MSTLLDVEDLAVSYGHGAEVIGGFSFSVAHGEKVAIVGESGSGKSTAAAAILGLLPSGGRQTAGSITFNGERLDTLQPWALRQYRGARIGYVPQDPTTSLNPVIRVGRQVAEVLLLHGLATKRSAAAEVVELLERAGVDNPELRASQYPQDLSGGQRQRVLIAIALACSPELIIADEPTSALDVTVQRRILDHLDERTRTSGSALLFITHDLGVAADRADRILVVHRGRIVEQGRPEQVLGDPRDAYTRRLLAAAPSLTEPTRAPRRSQGPLVEVSGLSRQFKVRRGEHFTAVDEISFTIGRGQTVGLVGESGSGKTTTARIITRLESASAGQVRIAGEDITELRGAGLREFRRTVQLVPQNPYASLNPKLTVRQIVREPLDAFGEGSRAERDTQAREWLAEVGLGEEFLERRPARLSGGQRQRVAIARALTLRPQLVVLDEPVSALDVSVQAQILSLLVSLQEEHDLSYLFVSHDLAVIRQISDSVVVMRSGRIVEQGSVDAVFHSPTAEYTRELLAAIPGTARFASPPA